VLEIGNGIQMDFTECEVDGVFSSRVGKFASLKLKTPYHTPSLCNLSCTVRLINFRRFCRGSWVKSIFIGSASRLGPESSPDRWLGNILVTTGSLLQLHPNKGSNLSYSTSVFRTPEFIQNISGTII